MLDPSWTNFVLTLDPFLLNRLGLGSGALKLHSCLCLRLLSFVVSFARLGRPVVSVCRLGVSECGFDKSKSRRKDNPAAAGVSLDGHGHAEATLEAQLASCMAEEASSYLPPSPPISHGLLRGAQHAQAGVPHDPARGWDPARVPCCVR